MSRFNVLLCVLLPFFLVEPAAVHGEGNATYYEYRDKESFEPPWEKMSIRERRETRLKFTEQMINNAKDVSIDKKYMDLGGDPWFSPRYLSPEYLVNGYNSRRMSNPLYPTYYRFESAYEQDKHRAMIIECLLDLLGDTKHPCVRMAAAQNLGRFSNDDLKSSEKN